MPTRLANLPANLLTRPGTESDSCTIMGMRRIHAAKTVGKLPYPPLQITTSGNSKNNFQMARSVPQAVLNMSGKFLGEKYTRCLPAGIILNSMLYSNKVFSSNGSSDI